MKLLFFLVCLSAATSSVIAPGGASTSETDAVSESRRFTGPYVLIILRPTATYRGYSKQLQKYARAYLGLPDLTVTSAAGHSFRIKPDTLRKDMNHEKDLRRFLYLGPTRHRRKDMLLAFPLRLRAPRSKERIFAIVAAKPPNEVVSHGFFKASQPTELAESIYKGGYSPDYLEPGHVLTIQEVFSELRTIDYRRIRPI
ncbi:uncharacterized protein UBRO_20010 [Ustilago bromivora]|uniref:Effector family protein Eff1 n=1 Tax=Ustilago bromivora TaxID=307758 RepID=A0A1K0GBW9_9BASI|nr:uncharacterized protein UBRO_20010 [Ustilago bromivora]